MGPSNITMAGQLRQMILYHVDNNLLDNALFLAGRLNCIDSRNSDSIHLLALCHLRLGQHKLAYDYCRITALRGAHLGCAYVFAQACLALQRYTDGVAALERARALWTAKTQLGCGRAEDANRRFLPDAAAVFCLLGKLLWANNDSKRAVECYVEALKLNPFMWDAFERLCETNIPIRASAIFTSNPELLAFLCSTQVAEDTVPVPASSWQSSKIPNWYTPSSDPFNPKPPADPSSGLGSSNITSKLNISASSIPSAPSFTLNMETPPAQHGSDDTVSGAPQATHHHSQIFAMEPPNAPLRRHRPEPSTNGDVAKLQFPGTRPRPKASSSDMGQAAEPKKSLSQSIHPKRTISGHSTQSSASTAYTDPTAAPQRRSVRLYKKDKDSTVPVVPGPAPMKDLRDVRKVRATGTRGRTATTSTVGRIVSGNRKPLEVGEGSLKEARVQSQSGDTAIHPPRQILNDGPQDREALKDLLDMMSKLACGYYALSKYQCSLALQYFQNIPTQHRDSPWVLTQIGKAQYEQNNYLEAEKTFARIRKICPSRVEDMEVYSTVLWHLKNDTELAFLSHELVELERLSPQAWCTIGNSFSLSRDHEQALKCFKRSTQLDSQFAYGFTLQGHEHVENEDFEKALLSYRKAIAVDRRHYNGWYGLGKVYDKLGKYDMAEAHFRRAAEINPNNAIIGVCIGVVLEKQKKPQLALQQYERASVLAPTSAISKFKKARVLLSLHRHGEALEEFLQLKDLAPDESNVHFMLGRTYKMLHDKAKAVRHYTIALNLDPKAAQYIKEAMEDLDDDDEDMHDDEEQIWTSKKLKENACAKACGWWLDQESFRPIPAPHIRSLFAATLSEFAYTFCPRSVQALPVAMSILSWAAYFLSFYLATVATLYASERRMPVLGYYARLLAAWGCLILCAVYGVVASIILRIVGYPGLSQWTVARGFKWTMLYATGVTFEIEGEEHLQTRPAVFIGNHQTELDVLMLGCIFPPYCSVTAKKSLKWLPFLGWFMALSNSVFIDRGNRKAAGAALDGAAQKMKNERLSVFMFPEGTRSYALEPELLPFKKGAFHLAVQAQVPVVPIVVANYSNVLHVQSRRFTTGSIPVKVLPPISTEGLTSADVDRLTTETRDKMLEELHKVTLAARSKAIAVAQTYPTSVDKQTSAKASGRASNGKAKARS